MTTLLVTGGLFPLMIVGLALWETLRGHLGRRLAFMADLSYSSYLIHFPLQILCIGLTSLLGVDREFFYRDVALIAFFAVLVPLCLASYHFFEKPAQAAIRKWLLHGRPNAGLTGETV